MNNLLAASLPFAFAALIFVLSSFFVMLTVYLVLHFDFDRAFRIKRRQGKELLASRLGDGFKELKKKYLMNALIKSLICGLAAGLIAVGVILLIYKLNAVTLHPGYYVLIGFAVAVVFAIIICLILMPTNTKLAKQLDNEYGLNEKTQTSLEFACRNGAMVEIQREDTDERLKNLPERKFSFLRIWQYCVIVVIALAISLTAFIIPAKKVAGTTTLDPNDNPNSVMEIQIKAIEELIGNVFDSKLDDDTKVYAVNQLEALIAELREADTDGKILGALYSAMDNIDGEISKINTYVRMSETLERQKSENISRAVLKGGDAYSQYILTEYSHVRRFYNERYDAVIYFMSEDMAVFNEGILSSVETNFSGALNDASINLQSALSYCGIDPQDGLYVSISNFATSLIELKNKFDNNELGEKTPEISFGEIIDDFEYEVSEALGTQSYYYAMNTFIDNKLKDIFGIPYETPEKNPDLPQKDVGGGDIGTGGSGSGGGGGEGGNRYGSDDEIWDPYSRAYVKYGEVLDRYYAIVQEYMKTGSLTQEQRSMLNLYYEILYGGKEI